MAIRAVLFDATGTLIHLAEPVGATYRRIARRYGIEHSETSLDRAFRRSLALAPACVFPGSGSRSAVEAKERQWWREVVRKTFAPTTTPPATAPPQRATFEAFDDFFDEVFGHYARARAWRLAAGAQACLRELSQCGLRLGVVSNFDHRLTELLQELGIGSHFRSVTIPANMPTEATAAKPDPAIFGAALALLEVRPDEAVYVGDDEERDLRPARALGMAALQVSDLPDLAALPARLRTLATLAPPEH
jgi:putative hydrolase of the HAD superfamily